MPVTTARARLRAALSEQLVPVLLAKGFRGPSELKGNSLLHEYRRVTPQGTHVLTIQFEKYQRPRFVLGFYVEPPEGMKNLMRSGGTIIAAQLRTRPGATTHAWFRADRSWWERVILRRSDTLENEAVQLCLSLLPEVEAWLSTGNTTPRISSWPVTYVAQTAGI